MCCVLLKSNLQSKIFEHCNLYYGEAEKTSNIVQSVEGIPFLLPYVILFSLRENAKFRFTKMALEYVNSPEKCRGIYFNLYKKQQLFLRCCTHLFFSCTHFREVSWKKYFHENCSENLPISRVSKFFSQNWFLVSLTSFFCLLWTYRKVRGGQRYFFGGCAFARMLPFFLRPLALVCYNFKFASALSAIPL
jgi:hypothetical protein